MKLTNLQRIILVVYAIVIINICIFFAPKSFFARSDGVNIIQHIEYSPVWRNSHYFRTRAIKQNASPQDVNNAGELDWYIRIDYYRMFVEIFVATVIASILFVLSMFPKEKLAKVNVDATPLSQVTQKKKIPWWGWMLISWAIFPGAVIVIAWIADLISKVKGGS
ncbi:hypothetical protein [Mahella australiensis]|jgi:hypothetical protein|uniref:Uncharacterized protein n=1 Tax=Mahella australiensis (strain DSM 15567 / CIP 107919 / 50-1 BON) TaxID=697281 RepID=F3ZVV2_MAHA5|nr:hypothetical protein [Mahella australiensis]AEE95326.1 hypothetical protein Mahau_0103 [Mahella australiensis 50-1 BON]